MKKNKKKKYKKPDYISQEKWDNYLNAIQDFGKNFVSMATSAIKQVNEKIKEAMKKLPVDNLELVRDENENSKK